MLFFFGINKKEEKKQAAWQRVMPFKTCWQIMMQYSWPSGTSWITFSALWLSAQRGALHKNDQLSYILATEDFILKILHPLRNICRTTWQNTTTPQQWWLYEHNPPLPVLICCFYVHTLHHFLHPAVSVYPQYCSNTLTMLFSFDLFCTIKKSCI